MVAHDIEHSKDKSIQYCCNLTIKMTEGGAGGGGGTYRWALGSGESRWPLRSGQTLKPKQGHL